MPASDVAAVLDAYPRIYFACHRRHVYDAEQRRLISAHQASILDHLDTVESTVLSDLAKHMGVTPSTMSLAVDRLEGNGYVVRERDAADRRRVRIRLTEAGVRVRRANSVLDPALVAEMLAQLQPAERREALRGLQALARAADASRRVKPAARSATATETTRDSSRRGFSMRPILVVLALLAVLVAIVIAVGLMLPKEHTARTHATINALPDAVWRVLTEVDAFPSWRRDLTRVEILASSNGPQRWREVGKGGTITFEQVSADPPRRLVSRIADPTLPFGGSWTYDVTAEGSGTRVTITEDGVVHNPVFRFMSRYVFGHHATQEAFLRALGRKFGHDATPVRG